ncbi:MAG: ureidoglycolate lyase [Anaerolineae bacterium]|nr:ureidoglycolate lyase [Anaerolineae bacterium]
MKTLPIKTISKESFGQYGVVLEHVNQEEGYEPLVTVESRGWIWAVLTFRWQSIPRIECHPTSKESFEPVFGTTVIVVAPPKDPDAIEAFLLDQAVMLHEGMWHEVMALSDVARVKITENNDVTTEYHDLGFELSAALVGE